MRGIAQSLFDYVHSGMPGMRARARIDIILTVQHASPEFLQSSSWISWLFYKCGSRSGMSSSDIQSCVEHVVSPKKY